MSDIPREVDFTKDEFIAKRIKVAEVEEKKEDRNLDILIADGNEIVSTVSVGLKKGNNTAKQLVEIDNQIPDSNMTTQDTMSCSSKEVESQFVDNLCNIDAAAAEDKGSRHKMEDAWVVLPNASLDYSGRLRCSHFAIYDGHGGRLAAEFAQKHLHANVLSAGLPRELGSCEGTFVAFLGLRSAGFWGDAAAAWDLASCL